ncbi:MAG: flavin-containing monooxygenase [Solirubrobacteraceae bacterium]
MRTTTDLDVLVVGAGLSGIGAACHLRLRCPQLSFAVLEGRDRIGGTWDLFRYPGVRSDSDMHTLGYSFAPWRGGETLADGPSILAYVRETAQRFGVSDHVRTGHRVVAARWSGEDARWTVQVEVGGGNGGGAARVGDGGGQSAGSLTLSCRFLLLCTGYYRYDRGHAPAIEGVQDFQGELVHPQHWPEELDCAGRRVIVIGSGATAVTLVPALARTAAHVTMVQRSPSWIVSVPSRDRIARWLDRRLPERLAHRAVRAKNEGLMIASYQLSRRRPTLMAALLRAGARRELPAGYPVDVHFNPSYDPWDQRMCVVPDGDLFRAVADGRATIVTDTVKRLTPTGLRLGGGEELDADVIVTATGLELLALGGVALEVDGEPIDLPQRLVYRGMMLSGVPNLAFTVGYTNASWTLKADLTARHVCRLLTHMGRHGHATAVPVPSGTEGERRPLIGLASGYVRRSLHEFPSQGSRRPWLVRQNYWLDVLDFRRGGVDDGVMRFDGAGTMGVAQPEPAGAR